MVIVDRVLYIRRTSRLVVRSLGVGEEVMAAAEATNPGLEWRSLVNALDRVFLSRGGAMGQVSFLHSPSPALEGRTPLEAMAEPEGPHKICYAARVFSAERG